MLGVAADDGRLLRSVRAGAGGRAQPCANGYPRSRSNCFGRYRSSRVAPRAVPVHRLGTAVDVDEGAYLTRKGEPGREFFLVLDGEASCRVRRKELHRFRAGDHFGELALLHGGLRTADVVAVTPMVLLARREGVRLNADDDAEDQLEDAVAPGGAAGDVDAQYTD